MPELPEAETITRALDRTLKKRKIQKVEIFTPKLRTPLKPLCTAKLEGRAFTGCRRRARYAVANLDDGRTLVFHFGMTGTVRVDSREVQRRKHDLVVLTLDDDTELRFNDPRRFGSVEVQCRGKDGRPESLAGIGVEPLSKDFTGEMLFAASRGRKKPVKELIMDNALVTGIGNIYAAETLFACGIRPQRPRLATDARRMRGDRAGGEAHPPPRSCSAAARAGTVPSARSEDKKCRFINELTT